MSGEAKVLTREEERDLRKWAKSAGGCGCNLRWHRLFVTLDAERARADAAEADAAALRGALNNWLAAGCCPGFEIQCGSYSGCDAETTKATDCPSCGPLRAALAPGAGTRFAAVVEAVREILNTEDGAEHVPGSETAFVRGDLFEDLRATLAALDGEGARDGK